ncbi:MAG: TolC family protein [Nitrospirota bacterium]|jgi:outer membrane protein TolC
MPGISRLLLTLGLSVVTVASVEAAGLDDLVATALRDNPQVHAAREAWAASRQVPAQVGAFADPQAGVAWYLSPVETRVGPQEARLFLSQKLPFWGKRGLRADAAERVADGMGAMVRDVELAVVTDVKARYYDLAYVAEAVRVTEADRALVADIVESALAHYRAGHGQQRDVLRAQVALSRDTDRLLDLKEQRATLEARLNRLLGRAEGSPLGDAALPDELPVLPTMAELVTEMEAARPGLLALEQQVEAHHAGLSLAHKAFYPDLTVRADYTITDTGPLPVSDNGEDSYWVTLGINVPIWRGRLRAGVAEAERRLAVAEAAYRDELDRGREEVADLRFRLATSLNQVALFDTGLVPQAEQALRATMDAYRTGQARFLDLLDAERDWLELRIAAFRARADLFQQQARLERAVGRLRETHRD